jgi:Flp pilus assembly protein TadD
MTFDATSPTIQSISGPVPGLAGRCDLLRHDSREVRGGDNPTISRANDMNRKMRRAQSRGSGKHKSQTARSNQNRAEPLSDDVVSLFTEALRSHQAGQLAEAIALYDRVLLLKPDLPEAHGNRGVALAAARRLVEAEFAHRRAIALKPDFADAHNNLGIVLCERGAHGDAEAALRRAVTLKPNWPQCRLNLAVALKCQGKFLEAEAAIVHVIALDPNNADAFSNLGDVLWCLGRLADAENALRHAVALQPRFADAVARLGNVLREQGKLTEAEAACRQALALDDDHAGAWSGLGNVLADRGELGAAEAAYRRAIALQPNFAEAYNNLGAVLKQLGRMAETREIVEQAVRLVPKSALHFLNLGEIRRFTAGDPYLAEMEELYRNLGSLPVKQQIELNFALAKAYDDVGRFDASFERLTAGNALKRGQIAYDEAATLKLFERIRAVFTPALLQHFQEKFPDAGEPSALPVFVIGMPRSGTTLIEQILASHRQAFGAGELRTLFDTVAGFRGEGGSGLRYPDTLAQLPARDVQALGARYVADIAPLAPQAARIVNKMPSNFLFAGLVHLALPNARIIHTVRDPLDTCLSCFSKLFVGGQPQTYELAELGRYYRHYRDLMAHWHAVLPPGRILDVRYEDVVADLDGQARRIIAHCGLDWDARCLDFHRTARPVRTASAAQVRQPIYGNAVGRGRPYEPFLRPLVDALAGAA